jgi:ABC-type multidrug transport system ATPase subunit
VLVCSHALSEVEQTADHVLVLAGGRLLVFAVLSYLNSGSSP